MARFILSQNNDYTLENANQDIRGWPVRDRAGQDLGQVRSLVADTDTEMVEAIVLHNGTEIPARDIDIGSGVVYVRSAPPVHTGEGATPRVSPYGDVRIRRY